MIFCMQKLSIRFPKQYGRKDVLYEEVCIGLFKQGNKRSF